ncbi:beta strand repeat-containing protein [Ramlibacter alkalitolerans]|uniref:DUF11 domain-containing protein n=2 Tax=Ramlibacter alkalitolerans TaxID=2039631 RepID=A0ABS1JPD5_9BURK|nr:DUF11 domain-containing protein [Ramlibacter alkalitolerans]
MAVAVLMLLTLWLAPTPARAAAPTAGVSISNQASATYSDGSGVSRTVSSNVVQTTVTQVYSLLLATDGVQTATPGSVVYYPHTLTNTGNGSDKFRLTTSQTNSPAMSAIEIYADNGSGAPTGAPITSTQDITVAAGATFKFIVRGTVPTTATAGNTNTITVTATSQGDTGKTGSNTDTTTVTGNAVMQLTKSISVSSGPAGTNNIQYTLTYTNNGNSDASTVVITDILPSGMSMNGGSGLWSGTGTTALTENVTATSGTQTLKYTYDVANRKFVATINKVTVGQSGQVKFTVTVASGTAPGVLNNTASVDYATGGTPASATSTSNSVAFTVTQTADVSVGDATFAPSPAPAGTTVTTTNVVTNKGNGSDTFNITLSGSNFPAGTSFQLFKSDGTTPLVDTNNDGIIDTGPVNGNNGTYNVVVRATLPPNATGTSLQVNVVATSTLNTGVSAMGKDTLGQITAASVDLTNDAVTGSGVKGAGVSDATGGAVQVSKAADPGTTVVFTLVANNTGLAPDTYNFSVGTTVGGTTLPAGWTVEFRTAVSNSCSSTGTTVTNTGTILAGGNAFFCAVVSVPTGFAPGAKGLFFRLLSPASGAADVLQDEVVVNTVRSVALTPNGTGQTYPGGSYVYVHTLTNNGNVDEGGALSSLTPDVPATGGWSSTLYVDMNGNGALDANDTIVTGPFNLTLAKGASITVLHRVIAPSGAVPGSVYGATITVTTSKGTYTVAAPAATVATDSTTVIAGNLTLVKEQALDTNCDGTPEFVAPITTWTQATLSAKPDQCVLYRVTVTNVGAADATNVVVSDATPTFTKISTVPSIASGHADSRIVAPPLAVGATGSIKAHIGMNASDTTGGILPAGQSAVITFGVRIDK